MALRMSFAKSCGKWATDAKRRRLTCYCLAYPIPVRRRVARSNADDCYGMVINTQR